MSVLVIGAGWAGAAAAYRAVQTNEPCVWLHAGLGASAIAPGELHWNADTDDEPSAAQLAALQTFGRDVAGWNLPNSAVRVVTAEGQIRTARGCERALLDVTPFAGQSLAVLDVERAGWDGPWLCRSLNESAWAKESRTRFFPLKVNVDLPNTAAQIGAQDFAQHLQSSDHFIQALLAALSQCAQAPAALLAGPWLVQNAEQLAELSARCGLPVGETSSPPYGLAGARFELARERWAERQAGLELQQVRAQRLEVSSQYVRVWAGERSWQAQRCVLAIGGLAGGGVELDAQRLLRSSVVIEPSAQWTFRQRPWLTPATETGLDVQAFGQEEIAGVGLHRVLAAGRLVVAGDLEADQPRTALRAAWSGLAAWDALA